MADDPLFDANERNSSPTCSMNSVPTHRPSSTRGRRTISPRTWYCASTSTSRHQGSSCAVRGAASPNDEEPHLRVKDFPWLVATIRPDRHQVSSASVGCGAWPTSSTTRMCAEPTVVVLEPTRPRWMRRSGASRDAVAKRRLGGTPTPRSLGGSGHEAASTYRCQARAPPSGRLGNLESQCLVRSDSSTVVHVIRSPQPSSE